MDMGDDREGQRGIHSFPFSSVHPPTDQYFKEDKNINKNETEIPISSSYPARTTIKKKEGRRKEERPATTQFVGIIFFFSFFLKKFIRFYLFLKLTRIKEK